MNDLGLRLLKCFEGCKLTAYLDSVGVATIGYGHTGKNITEGLSWTQDQADNQLMVDIDHFQVTINELVRVPLNSNEMSALTMFTFNVGPHNLENSTLLKKINSGDFDVSSEFAKWNHAGRQVLEGLTERRKAEALLFAGDVDAVEAIIVSRS